MFSQDDLQAAAALVHSQMPATPQYAWPMLAAHSGCNLWVKHENHTPTGAFKVRGGITFMAWLKQQHPNCQGIITATRGNHGQSQALAASRAGLRAKVLVPRGNSPGKNAAMAAFGAELVVHGQDFDEAREEAMRLAAADDLFPVPPFHLELARGVSTYALELFTAVPDLDTVYVPIGCGSGICATIMARDAMGLDTKVVGVVSTEAAAAKLSVDQGHLVSTNSANTMADGMAVRVPVQEAFDIYSTGADRVLMVTDAEVEQAMRLYYHCCHTLAEGAGAASLAGLLQEREQMAGKTVAVILSGGNVDAEVFARVLLAGADSSQG